mmetsp:Transcript_4723/g.8117  ORF Transcript_4723/g.8117 Transcript_4723/m.8117 type:complete len:93 (+) Transcript_4723:143-421(+)|eukprot:CAMPEP_0196659334 /NCGR_PEP_ID=MMETSP1086-20130531/34402_1 /TAXON_ID=77921 /ORGANISM="Cyanoptyche  gloeocystis , Strain SAG4.97" /LENGTH=92 /DNA_ID=CAMNT_0041993275 /DNA_START=142 /DNA_END=420 /DNA_ORIENTATION=+
MSEHQGTEKDIGKEMASRGGFEGAAASTGRAAEMDASQMGKLYEGVEDPSWGERRSALRGEGGRESRSKGQEQPFDSGVAFAEGAKDQSEHA